MLTLSVPVVTMNMQPIPGLLVAAIDNRAGGRLATDHLLAQGYRRIGIISGPDSWWEAQQRELGWRDSLSAAGITALDELKCPGDWYPSSGDCGLEKLLARVPDLEAVFACNDPMALGVLQAARRLGISVPHDLAVVGFDDVPEAAYYYPALTTVRQPLVELGAQAVDMLNHILRSQEPETASPVWLAPQLVIRDSSDRTQRAVSRP